MGLAPFPPPPPSIAVPVIVAGLFVVFVLSLPLVAMVSDLFSVRP